MEGGIIYDEDSEKELDKITGCTEHKEIGSSSDGKYKYYLSTNKDADETLRKEVEEIAPTFTEMTPFQQLSAFIPHTPEMYQNVYPGSDLPSDRFQGKIDSHQCHRFNSGKHILTAVCVKCRKTSIMSCVQALQHIHGLSSTDFPYNYPVRPHSKGRPDQISDRY